VDSVTVAKRSELSKIVIGESEGQNLKLDLELLIPSRLLIQANSGGGKSWLLRRMAEQFFGKIQTIIIDPEGEFFTLREKFGYVLVGEGGETPADVRSAALLAEKFLQLKASAVCDLYEAFRSRPMDRRQWVRSFLNALLDAPRALWHPLIVIVDEAHKFCPQESPKAASMTDREIIGGCKDAMIALSTTGRKRGFCPIWATQRLAKLDKDASAEFFNRLVGMTIEDVDVDRAADLMSVSKDEKQAFRASLRQLTPGEFYAFGRAITTERKLVKVGEVQTHHPETGRAAKNAEAPPMPEEVKGFLPQLADLPKAAEEKARTEAEYKREIRELRQKLNQAQKVQPAPAAKPMVDSRVVKQATDKATAPLLKQLAMFQKQARFAIDFFTKGAAQLNAIANAQLSAVQISELVSRLSPAAVTRPIAQSEPVAYSRPQQAAQMNGDLSGPQQNILNQLAELDALGISTPERSQLSLMAGYTNWRSGGFSEPLSNLIENGLVRVPVSGRVALTDVGRSKAAAVEAPLSTEELHDRLCRKLGGPEEKLLREILAVYPEAISKEDLGGKLGYTNVRSGGFSEPIGRLRSLGIIDYPNSGFVRAADWLYLDGAA
jgi:hypothetical protein